VPHVITIKVRGYHLDMYGHVNNARYLEFLEEARWSLLEDNIDLDEWVAGGRGFVVMNIDITYRRPARFGDLLQIRSAVTRLARRKGIITQEVVAQATGKLVAVAAVTFGVTDAGTGKLVPFAGEIRDTFAAFAELTEP